jgi:hypothetical protein
MNDDLPPGDLDREYVEWNGSDDNANSMAEDLDDVICRICGWRWEQFDEPHDDWVAGPGKEFYGRPHPIEPVHPDSFNGAELDTCVCLASDAEEDFIVAPAARPELADQPVWCVAVPKMPYWDAEEGWVSILVRSLTVAEAEAWKANRPRS